MAVSKSESLSQPEKENVCLKFSLLLSDIPVSISCSDQVAEQQIDSSLRELFQQV